MWTVRKWHIWTKKPNDCFSTSQSKAKKKIGWNGPFHFLIKIGSYLAVTNFQSPLIAHTTSVTTCKLIMNNDNTGVINDPLAKQWLSLDFEVLGRTDGRTCLKIVNTTGRSCGRPRGSIYFCCSPLFYSRLAWFLYKSKRSFVVKVIVAWSMIPFPSNR